MKDSTVAIQFQTLTRVARDCDAIVGATTLQVAAASVAEKQGIPYFFAAYCPAVLPSSHHAPPVVSTLKETAQLSSTEHKALWARDAERFDTTFGPILNTHRKALGLPPVKGVRRHIFTNRPWLAADPVLAPWPEDEGVLQTGAWLTRDERPLSAELEAFLEDGEPPVYFGFGSMRAPKDLSQVLIQTARNLGRRVILSKGWADLPLVDKKSDCFAVGEVNQQALFQRVAAVVHHGGAGTTLAAARTGTPQAVVPQMYDQPYWAERVRDLGIGTAHPPGLPTVRSLTNALANALDPTIASEAMKLASQFRDDGARTAAKHLVDSLG